MERKGFTLVELLAVIVILAIILAIAIPNITNLIGNASKSAFEADAKLVLKALDYKLLENDSFDLATVNETNIESLLKISAANYQSVKVNIENGKPQIIIVGQGKWDDLVASGSSEKILVHKGLVLWLDGKDFKNSPVTTTWVDRSGNGNNGTTSGFAYTSASGSDNQGNVVLDGVDDYINCGHNSSLMPSSITIEAWFKFNDTEATSWMVVNKENGGVSGSYYIYNGSYNSATWSIFGPSPLATRYDVNLGTTFVKGTYYQMVGTFDATTKMMKTYVNGVLKGSYDNGALGANSADVLIGRYTSGYYLDGTVRQIRIYNRALSNAEVANNYTFDN